VSNISFSFAFRREKHYTQFVYKNGRKTNEQKTPPPFNITVIKGAIHITGSREFIHFAVHDKKAVTFGEWLKDGYIPDERFFSTLINNPQLGAPGAYEGNNAVFYITLFTSP
jgi:hypothetical protein